MYIYIIINYKQKYLKYKLKYLNLKKNKFTGGMNFGSSFNHQSERLPRELQYSALYREINNLYNEYKSDIFKNLVDDNNSLSPEKYIEFKMRHREYKTFDTFGIEETIKNNIIDETIKIYDNLREKHTIEFQESFEEVFDITVSTEIQRLIT